MADLQDRKRRRRRLLLGQLVILVVAFLIASMLSLTTNPNLPSAGTESFLPVDYVTITLTNNQSIPTAVGFQQLVKIPWHRYIEYLNPDVSNVRFFNSTNFENISELHAWLETNASSTAQSSSVWVNLAGTIIPAFGFIQIYMSFLPKNTTWGTYWGLAPSLSAQYGSYDNGNAVFPQGYWNFSGMTTPPGWTIIGGKVDNGLTLERSGAGRAYHPMPSGQDDIVEMYQTEASGLSNNYAYSALGVNITQTIVGWTESSTYFVPSNRVIYPLHGLDPRIFYTEFSEPAGNWGVTGVFSGPENTTFYYNNEPVLGVSLTIGHPLNLQLWTGGPNGTNVMSQFIYLRDVPPDNYMPEVSISGAEIAVVYYPMVIENHGTEPTANGTVEHFVIDWHNYSKHLNDNVSNVRFFLDLPLNWNSELTAWISDNNSPNANASDVWVNLGNHTISANGSLTIYLVIMPKSISWDDHWYVSNRQSAISVEGAALYARGSENSK